MCSTMLPALSTTRPGILSERLLITKLITSVGLALLLLLGLAASATHSGTEGSSPASLVLPVLHDPHTESMSAHGAMVDSEQALGATISSTGDHALLGTALCALGLLCGFVFAVLMRAILRRRTLPDPLSRPLSTVVLVPPTIPPRASSLTLTQLGLSRT